jgi:hypothetical protein
MSDQKFLNRESSGEKMFRLFTICHLRFAAFL